MADPILTLSLFVHLVATVVWIGGLALFALVVWPALHHVLADDPRLPDLLRTLRKRFNPLANLSLVALILTGMIQMGADPNYEGLLAFGNDWSRAMLFKHIAIVGMVIVSAILQWGVAPAQERVALLRASGKATPDVEPLARRERRLHVISLVLSIAVLVFTAVATAI